MQSPHWRCVHVAWANSTQDLVLARSAERAGLVVWTTDQRAGRGRVDRVWLSPPGSGIAMSLLLKPETAVPPWTWYSLMLSCAAARSISDRGIHATVKWPNDVLVGERKIAGLLATATGDCLVLGIGMNTSMTIDELPESRATSLAVEGASDTDAQRLVDDVLRHFALLLDSPDWADIYREHCSTIGLEVSVQSPTGHTFGRAVGISDGGELIVHTAQGDSAFHLGDVIHVR